MITNRRQVRDVERQIVLWEQLRKRTAYTMRNYFKLQSIPPNTRQAEALQVMDEAIDELRNALKEFNSKSVRSSELAFVDDSLGKRLIHARSMVRIGPRMNWPRE